MCPVAAAGIHPPLTRSHSRSAAEFRPQGREIVWRLDVPGDGLAGFGVNEAEAGGVEHGAGSAAAVRSGSAVHRPVVDRSPHSGAARFAEMNANLVGAAGFQPAFDDGEIAELVRAA